MATEIPLAGPAAAGGIVTSALSEPDEKGSAQETQSPAEAAEQPQDFPLTWKIAALICGVALSWGSSFSENTLGTLKSTLKKQLDITNQLRPSGPMACSIAIFIGAVVSAAGSNLDSFTLVVTGRVIMGLGSTVIETCMSKISAHWFQHRGLGLVYGLDLLIGKLIVLIAKATAVPMRDASSFWGWALWIPAIVCFANLRLVGASRFGPRWAILTCVPRFFWLVACTQILQAGVVGDFNGLNADIITETPVQQFIPVVGALLIGSFFDSFGYRMTFATSTMNALPFPASIPLIVPNQIELGLVFGIWKAFNNSGSVIVDMIAGRLQDITPDGIYERVIAFFVAVKGLEFCLGLFYGILDRKYLAGILIMSEKKRMQMEQECKLRKPIGRKPAKLATIIGIALVCAMIVIAWVLFIKYSL
ncbi:hypothetical protein EDB82DRAFT_567395 [Fusarium venenatum]|uniref:uncharacterized protein n=1 Tax=Fusarium venenatum TaxID=56646 RepID=UPI001E01F6BA|nr:hypothetical protein EDB82DRAFT_567395 [Fusarium venenatum]